MWLNPRHDAYRHEVLTRNELSLSTTKKDRISNVKILYDNDREKTLQIIICIVTLKTYTRTYYDRWILNIVKLVEVVTISFTLYHDQNLILRDFDQHDDIKKIVSNIEYVWEKFNHFLWHWITHEIVCPFWSSFYDKI